MIQASRTNGGRYLTQQDYNAMQRERRDAKQAQKMRQRHRAMAGWAIFLVGNSLMFYMITHGLINEPIGMGCLIAISFGCGRYGR